MSTDFDTETPNGNADYMVPMTRSGRSHRRLIGAGIAVAALAAAAVVTVALTQDDPEPTKPTSAPTGTAADPTPVDEASDPAPEDGLPSDYDEILPVPLDMDGVVADLDGDGQADEIHVDTFPNTDGVTTSYEVWAKLAAGGKTLSAQMTGETPNYVSFKGVVDSDDELVFSITPGGDLATTHVYGMVSKNLQIEEWANDATALQTYESGDEAGNVYTADGRLLSGTTVDGGATWQMWEWSWDGSMLLPTSLGTKCGDDPAYTPPLDDC